MEKRKPFIPGYLAIVAFKDFDRRFSSAFTSTGMTCILTWMTKSSLDLVAFKFQVNKKAQNPISVYLQECGFESFCILLFEQQYRCGVGYFRGYSVYCIVHQLVELVIEAGLFLRVKLLYLFGRRTLPIPVPKRRAAHPLVPGYVRCFSFWVPAGGRFLLCSFISFFFCFNRVFLS